MAATRYERGLNHHRFGKSDLVCDARQRWPRVSGSRYFESTNISILNMKLLRTVGSLLDQTRTTFTCPPRCHLLVRSRYRKFGKTREANVSILKDGIFSIRYQLLYDGTIEQLVQRIGSDEDGQVHLSSVSGTNTRHISIFSSSFSSIDTTYPSSPFSHLGSFSLS